MTTALIIFSVWSFIIAPTGFTSHITRVRFSRAMSEHSRLVKKMNNISKSSDDLSGRLTEQKKMLEKFYTIYNIEFTSKGQGGMEQVTIPGSKGGTERLDLMHVKLDQQVAVAEKLLEELKAFEADNRNIAKSTPTICPIQGGEFILTSPYGKRVSPFTGKKEHHQGIDMAASRGTPVVVSANGRVSFSGRYPLRRSAAWWRYGKIVVVQHDKSFITIYAHLDKVMVKKGEQVKRGQIIGEVGNTGWSTSPHLHYEIRSMLVNGQSYVPVDPRICILDHHWSNLDQVLIAARSWSNTDYEPIPSVFRR